MNARMEHFKFRKDGILRKISRLVKYGTAHVTAKRDVSFPRKKFVRVEMKLAISGRRGKNSMSSCSRFMKRSMIWRSVRSNTTS